ncbi:hypothetical protein BC835DRAFT_1521700 [Cytidiella melzeri]|nr:hypothetical protein BC835DRAFT_1521700 [Cytidiella melzeri]
MRFTCVVAIAMAVGSTVAMSRRSGFPHKLDIAARRVPSKLLDHEDQLQERRDDVDQLAEALGNLARREIADMLKRQEAATSDDEDDLASGAFSLFGGHAFNKDDMPSGGVYVSRKRQDGGSGDDALHKALHDYYSGTQADKRDVLAKMLKRQEAAAAHQAFDDDDEDDLASGAFSLFGGHAFSKDDVPSGGVYVSRKRQDGGSGDDALHKALYDYYSGSQADKREVLARMMLKRQEAAAAHQAFDDDDDNEDDLASGAFSLFSHRFTKLDDLPPGGFPKKRQDEDNDEDDDN